MKTNQIFPHISNIALELSTNRIELSGLYGSALAMFLTEFKKVSTSTIVVLVAEPEDAEDLVSDLKVFGSNSYIFPPWDILPSESEEPDIDIAQDRVGALRIIDTNIAEIVVLCGATLLQPVLQPDLLHAGEFSVVAGMKVSPEGLIGRLIDAGFEQTDDVEVPGHFSRRGGIVDIFPFFSSKPVRLDFFGDEIDSIRYYDAGTQRSEKPTDEKIILIDINRDSFHKAYDDDNLYSLLDYTKAGATFIAVHPQRIEHNIQLYHSGFKESSLLFGVEDSIEKFIKNRIINICDIGMNEYFSDIKDDREVSSFDMNCFSLERLNGGFDHAFDELDILAEEKNTIQVYCNNAAEQARLSELLLERGRGLANKIELKLGTISTGFYVKSQKLVITTDQQILGRKQMRRAVRKKVSSTPIASFTDLRPGDYVVHLSHGIAAYDGVETIDNNGTQADYLSLRFAEDARVYVPMSHVDLVQRYIGGGGGKPTLSKLGSASWQKRKNAAEEATKSIASDLLRLQAARDSLPGIAFDPDDELQMEFDNAFSYAETPDQLAAIAEIKQDQEKANPMDRLLCGDVGFGKTEVAMRAAFKVVNNNKQVAILVPTTILAEQHARSFKERMADYPVNIECLSRFRTTKEAKEIIDRLKRGKTDIVIGTHRIISQDVEFQDLGLVIIDEEQRFGVEQKERLKEMRVSVDILSMSATPIPRTLNMAMLGLRDISSLTTAPTERQAIRTEVIRYDNDLIRRAILREISRGGQVFFLNNRVGNIDRVARELGELVPEARFGIGHGQMSEKQLFYVMNQFLNKKIDVLVCTTIIESGVDIPSVNTLFVNNADHFGLGELHQLRGRVGRYRNKAYAYFLIPARRQINPIAQKRLHALQEYSELGSGFRLAMRDLEIRGAGNILGSEQSGHIHLIGFELYCRLLEKSVAELKGEEHVEADPVELELGSVAYIPTEYIASDTQRVDFYRKLSAASDESELTDIIDFAEDKYGMPPTSVEQLFEDQRIRISAQEVGINYLGKIDNALIVGFAKGKGGPTLIKLRAMRRKVTSLDKSRWRVSVNKHDNIYAAAKDVLHELDFSLDDIEERAEDRAKEKIARQAPIKSHVASSKRYNEISSSYASSYTTKDKKTKVEVVLGALVVEVEPNARIGILSVIVDGKGFDVKKFGTVTLVCGNDSYYLRYTGTAHSGGKSYLSLRASSEEEVEKIYSHFTDAIKCILHNGIIE